VETGFRSFSGAISVSLNHQFPRQHGNQSSLNGLFG
jgi:hypothetical protein